MKEVKKTFICSHNIPTGISAEECFPTPCWCYMYYRFCSQRSSSMRHFIKFHMSSIWLMLLTTKMSNLMGFQYSLSCCSSDMAWRITKSCMASSQLHLSLMLTFRGLHHTHRLSFWPSFSAGKFATIIYLSIKVNTILYWVAHTIRKNWLFRLFLLYLLWQTRFCLQFWLHITYFLRILKIQWPFRNSIQCMYQSSWIRYGNLFILFFHSHCGSKWNVLISYIWICVLLNRIMKNKRLDHSLWRDEAHKLIIDWIVLLPYQNCQNNLDYVYNYVEQLSFLFNLGRYPDRIWIYNHFSWLGSKPTTHMH